MIRTLRLAILSLLGLVLPACMFADRLPFIAHDDGHVLAPGESATLHFFTRIANFDSGIDLQSGARYRLDIVLLNNWIDGHIERNERDGKLDEHGFANSLMPYGWLGWTRRNRDYRWFELMLAQPGCDSSSVQGISDLPFDEASGSYNFVAACDGKLTLFVNDSHGFYSNNVGYANIALSRVD